MHLIGNETTETPVFHRDPSALAAGLTAELVQQQLQRILRSPIFSRSKELCRFLRFAVDQKLRNRSVRLKEYMIGVTVFQRGETFNPGTDPIVRVQARRLRSKLTLYYETEGREDVVSLNCRREDTCRFFVCGPRSKANR